MKFARIKIETKSLFNKPVQDGSVFSEISRPHLHSNVNTIRSTNLKRCGEKSSGIGNRLSPNLNVIVHSATPMPEELTPENIDSDNAEKSLSPGVIVREILQVVVPALLLALVIHLFLAQATVVYGRSMEPNLSESQRLIIDKLTYRIRSPERNDIVVLNIPTMDEMLVKRVVGLPGESVAIRNGIVYINGQELEEDFRHNLSDYDVPEITLGPLSYFVLGDNRTNSNDSRVFGSIKREHIVGRVWLRYWPINQLRFF